MIPPHMSKSIRSSLETLHSSARGVVSVAVLIAAVSACHHSAPPPSMIMTPVPRDQAHTEATRAQLQELAITYGSRSGEGAGRGNAAAAADAGGDDSRADCVTAISTWATASSSPFAAIRRSATR